MAPTAKTSSDPQGFPGFTGWRWVVLAAAAAAVAVMYHFYAEAAAENQELRQKLAKVLGENEINESFLIFLDEMLQNDVAKRILGWQPCRFCSLIIQEPKEPKGP